MLRSCAIGARRAEASSKPTAATPAERIPLLPSTVAAARSTERAKVKSLGLKKPPDPARIAPEAPAIPAERAKERSFVLPEEMPMESAARGSSAAARARRPDCEFR